MGRPNKIVIQAEEQTITKELIVTLNEPTKTNPGSTSRNKTAWQTKKDS